MQKTKMSELVGPEIRRTLPCQLPSTNIYKYIHTCTPLLPKREKERERGGERETDRQREGERERG